MPKLTIPAVVIAAAFCCADLESASAQVIKNFSWKKKQKPAKAKPVESRQKKAVTAPHASSPGGRETPQ